MFLQKDSSESQMNLHSSCLGTLCFPLKSEEFIKEELFQNTLRPQRLTSSDHEYEVREGLSGFLPQRFPELRDSVLASPLSF